MLIGFLCCSLSLWWFHHDILHLSEQKRFFFLPSMWTSSAPQYSQPPSLISMVTGVTACGFVRRQYDFTEFNESPSAFAISVQPQPCFRISSILHFSSYVMTLPPNLCKKSGTQSSRLSAPLRHKIILRQSEFGRLPCPFPLQRYQNCRPCPSCSPSMRDNRTSLSCGHDIW